MFNVKLRIVEHPKWLKHLHRVELGQDHFSYFHATVARSVGRSSDLNRAADGFNFQVVIENAAFTAVGILEWEPLNWLRDRDFHDAVLLELGVLCIESIRC